MKKRDFLSITDVSTTELLKILSISQKLKKQVKTNKQNPQILKNKTLVMIFEKPSLRTRLSFEIGATQFGGHGVYLGPSDIGLGVRETIHDVSRVTASMANIVVARTFNHATVTELAKHAAVPVINGLSDLEHPCQTLADLLTILECKKSFSGLNIAFVGDGENNVVHSLALACAMLGMNFSVACPKGYWMNKEIAATAENIAKKTKATIFQTDSASKTVTRADVMYTDTWISMGDEKEKEKRLAIFKPYQVTEKLMKLAQPDAIFMHDMPAYRGNEVTEEVIDGKQSVIFDQAENRLHAQKGLMYFLLSK